MTRRYTLTTEEYKQELKNASPSQYALLISSAKQVDDKTVLLIVSTEKRQESCLTQSL